MGVRADTPQNVSCLCLTKLDVICPSPWYQVVFHIQIKSINIADIGFFFKFCLTLVTQAKCILFYWRLHVSVFHHSLTECPISPEMHHLLCSHVGFFYPQMESKQREMLKSRRRPSLLLTLSYFGIFSMSIKHYMNLLGVLERNNFLLGWRCICLPVAFLSYIFSCFLVLLLFFTPR